MMQKLGEGQKLIDFIEKIRVFKKTGQLMVGYVLSRRSAFSIIHVRSYAHPEYRYICSYQDISELRRRLKV